MSSGEGFVGADFPGACKAGTLAHHRRLQYICKFEFKCEECEDRDDLLTLPDVLVRLPTPYLAQFPDGRAHQETTTVRFRRQKTDVPLPQVLHHGRDETLGSHLIIRYMEHRRDMCDALAVPTEVFSLTPVPFRTQIFPARSSRTRIEEWPAVFCSLTNATSHE